MKPNSIKSGKLVIGLIVLSAGVVTFGAVVLRNGHNTSTNEQLTFVVRRGPLTISVTEGGTIKARDQEILKSRVEGQTTIIYLVPEGTRVKQGDLLVELDASRLQDDKVDQLINAQNAHAAFIRAQEDLAVVTSQGASDIAKSELDYRFAKEDLKQYINGQYPNELNEAEVDIKLKLEELERAREKLRGSKELFAENYISATELKADRLTEKRAELEHELAVNSRKLLEEFTFKRKREELESDITQTDMALERVQRKAKADEVQADAELKARDLEFKQQKSKLAKFEQQIEKTKIYAPIDGMVVYATSAKGSWRGNAEPLDEGQSVRERQELIYLPRADAVMAQVKVHESSLEKVNLNLPVRVTVEALPGKIFTGRVSRIAPLPDAQSLWLNPDLKIYGTDIHLDSSGEGLRTGMSCRAEILVERYDDAIYVPVQAVIRVGDTPMSFVMDARGNVEKRSVTIGLDNNRMVRILDGLEPGERVMLAPPLDTLPDSDRPNEAIQTEDADGKPVASGSGSDSQVAPQAVREKPKQPEMEGGDADSRHERGRGGPWQNMTDEQRAAMRKRFESMSEEERQKMQERWRSGRREQGEAGSQSGGR